VVAVKCEAPNARSYLRRFNADARALLKLLSLDSYELSLVLTGDSAIRELNRAFRGRDSSTDVLSFPQFDDFANARDDHALGDQEVVPTSLGDVVISVDTVVRQAARLGVAPESRLRTLLIHGVLHLLGYDHEKSRAEARRMFAYERELVAALTSNGKNPAPLPEIHKRS
jgi:rRNA maturation RNase YbeY